MIIHFVIKVFYNRPVIICRGRGGGEGGGEEADFRGITWFSAGMKAGSVVAEGGLWKLSFFYLIKSLISLDNEIGRFSFDLLFRIQ